MYFSSVRNICENLGHLPAVTLKTRADTIKPFRLCSERAHVRHNLRTQRITEEHMKNKASLRVVQLLNLYFFLMKPSMRSQSCFYVCTLCFHLVRETFNLRLYRRYRNRIYSRSIPKSTFSFFIVFISNPLGGKAFTTFIPGVFKFQSLPEDPESKKGIQNFELTPVSQ